MYNLNLKDLGEFDVAVIGGGISGTFAAASAARAGARVILVERSGALGGTLTEGFVPRIMDSFGKGGLVKELFDFLNENGMTAARSGAKNPETGRVAPGDIVDVEACKYFFDKMLADAGVKVLFYSQAAALQMADNKISSLLVVSEGANYSLRAKVFVDATGNGYVAALAGCKWECGDPESEEPQPVSIGSRIVGFNSEFKCPVGEEEKIKYASMLSENGIDVSAGAVTVVSLPDERSWTFSCNFGYGVAPDDTEKLSACTKEGRREIFETVKAHRAIDGFGDMAIASTSSHIGIREGRRIFGEYRISDADILGGRRFDDAICLVTLGVDVHKTNSSDTLSTTRGRRTKPFNIPYRATVPKGVENLLLSGRCISGDFYPHAAYRYMGNMATVGEAVGFAAAKCSLEGIIPKALDGVAVSRFMKERNYDL